MELKQILQSALMLSGSDVFIIPGSKVMAKVRGGMVALCEERVMPDETKRLIMQAYEMAQGRDMGRVYDDGDDDFSFSVEKMCRFRCNAYLQRGTLAATFRVVAFGLPDPKELGIPDEVMRLTDMRNGMILVTGPAGSGKSTTLACMVDRINQSRSGHIITIEDPIEFLHPHKTSLVSQREVPNDSATFGGALRAALRQAPDVILLGEMRDHDTMQTAITAAETGHLLLSSLHTVGAAKTIDRIIDSFPASQQQQIKIQLAMVLRAVVSQRLIPSKTGELLPVFEMMVVNSAIQNMIRESKTHQLDNAIYSGLADKGMISMDNELISLYRAGKIEKDVAIAYAVNADSMRKRLL